MATFTPTADCTYCDQERMRAAHRYSDWQLVLVKPWLRKWVPGTAWRMGRFTRPTPDRELVVGLAVEADRVARHRQNQFDYKEVVSLEADASNPPSIEVPRSDNPDSVVLSMSPSTEKPTTRRFATADKFSRMGGPTGFHPIPLHCLNFFGLFRWWANSHLFKKTEQPETQIATFDKLIVP